MYIGARIGANLANQSYDSLPSGSSTDINTGILAGIQFDYWFNDMWGLSAQVLYDEKRNESELLRIGIRFEGGTITSSGTGKLNFSYLEIPILLKMNIGNWQHYEPYVFAGPSFGFFLSGTENTNTSSSGPGIGMSSTAASQPVADSTSKFTRYLP